MLRSFCAWALFLTVVPVEARAYRTFTDLPELEDAGGERVAWHAFPIDLEVTEQPEAPAEGEATLRAVERAAALWNDAMCTEEVFGEIALTDLAATNDGYNTVTWVTNNWLAMGDATAVATTEPIYEQRGGRYVLVEADIFLNGDTVEWTDALLEDLDGVLAHELGHALGLAHPCEPDGAKGAPRCDEDSELTLMHPLYDAARVELTEDDEDGACFLYPDGRVEPPPAAEPKSDGSCAVSGGTSQSSAAGAALLFAFGLLLARRRR